MDLGLKGKVALVVAASRGLGKAVAWEFAREGAHVTICARREDVLRATALEIAVDTEDEVFPVVADVTKPEDIQRLIYAVEEYFGQVDILINNAGGSPTGTFMDSLMYSIV